MVFYYLDTLFLGDYLFIVLFYLLFDICFYGDMSDITKCNLNFLVNFIIRYLLFVISGSLCYSGPSQFCH